MTISLKNVVFILEFETVDAFFSYIDRMVLRILLFLDTMVKYVCFLPL
jgi:hypothetical protein